MTNKTQPNTLWTQSMFDSLCSSLDHGADDAPIKEVLDNLCELGYSASSIIKKVESVRGGAAARRITQILAGKSSKLAKDSRVKQRHKVSKLKRIKTWLREGQEDLEDTYDNLAERLRNVISRG